MGVIFTPRHAIALLALVAAASTARAAPKLPCAARLAGGADSSAESSDSVHAIVAGRDVLLGKAPAAPQELRVVAGGGAGALLVAWAGRDEHGPFGSSVLWKVMCKAGAPEPFISLDGADFGHSVLSSDGRTLYFAGPDGLFALELATRESRRLTWSKLAYCTDNHVGARDVPGAFVDRRTLSFERGCGYEHAWNAAPMRARDPGTPQMTITRAPRPPFPSVAAGAGGTVWLADGLCSDSSTFNRIFYSTDKGDHFRAVPVKMLYDQPARQVLADKDKPGAAIVWSYGCASDAHQATGWVYVTEDGGTSFRAITVPPGISAVGGEPAPEQDPIAGVYLPEGSIAHLLVYGRNRPGMPLLKWESRDAGRTFSPGDEASPPPVNIAPPVKSQDSELTIKADGLYRVVAGGKPERIFPRD